MTKAEAFKKLEMTVGAYLLSGHADDSTCGEWREILETLKQDQAADLGEVSDGYHTFNQLYHQRAVLFATIVNEHPDISWKSFKHFDGHYCFDEDGEMFIVGIDTPKGSYTYHYHKKYWDLFKCKELECGQEWDGHTEKDVTRLLSLEPCEDTISRKAVLEQARDYGSQTYLIPVNSVRTLPSVTPIRAHGKWVVSKINGQYQCYECTCFSGLTEEDVKEGYTLPKFCPNCGADMRKEQK